MSQMTWTAERPSNIALIKYMGKKDQEKNIPSNSSISWTLDHLVTTVELKTIEGEQDQWVLGLSDFPFEMTEKGRQKFLTHAKRVKDHFGVEQCFEIASSNNFPADCGIASSASSFAALTEALCAACSEISGKQITTEDKAILSSRGSGSSCRSFWSGMVLWNEDGVGPQDTALQHLQHQVVLLGTGAKEVSSSDAHKRIATSLLNRGRSERAETRLNQSLLAMREDRWQDLYDIVWQEFFDMHALFETATPPFSYFEPATTEFLQNLRRYWREHGDGPIVTMDAGPNVHLLWRQDQKKQTLSFFAKEIEGRWTCLSNIEEIGFAQI
jgi:diphosphomevalonate decarboxylase